MGLTFGKYGFKRPPSQVSKEKTINVGDLDYLIPQILSKVFINSIHDLKLRSKRLIYRKDAFITLSI
ncbi:hypothetical protein [Candidatus Methanoliparum sp. LAM-1]|uniref:hypothetical protein n=1 Tax=Candidatus Methanoliparum sp. LAM-1 TaxID=2874846 RepID=UPI001E535A42|nr:hypothetical protein [Candidatus Methanoliparum sp. LAM-1]BDC35362.1 hypothetical protein MTLP_00440 [Candidatus Methanoliparum sp. LAM-1]